MKSKLDLASNPGLFSGPLGSYAGAYVALLVSQGYRHPTIYPDTLLIADLDGWMKRRGIGVGDLSSGVMDRFLREHMRTRTARRCAKRRALQRLLRMLEATSVVAAEKSRPDSAERWIDEFAQYLRQQRGFAETTIANYCLPAARLLEYGARQRADYPSDLCAADVLAFTGHYIREYGRVSAQYATTGMRVFLRFLRDREAINRDLASVVPSVAGWSLAGLPRHLPAGMVNRVLAKQEHASRKGQRDYAILLLLARLGLRSCEVAGLRLDDLDWETGQITVRSRKASRTIALPLPPDVGRSIAKYLKAGRPSCRCREVFIRHRAPLYALSRLGVCHVARRAFLRAGVSGVSLGAHTFRHTLATDLLRKGASLDDIGRILRHRDPSTTAIYAKVDMNALRALAVRWPGGAP